MEALHMTMHRDTTLNRRELLGAAACLGAAAAVPSLAGQLRAEDEKDKPMPRFNYAICNETFGDWPLQRACEFSAECGYTGIELAPFTLAKLVTDITAPRRAEIRRTIERAGLKTVGLHWLLAKTTGFHLTSADKDVRRKTGEYLAELARFCAEVGGTVMVFGSPKQRDLAEGMDRQTGMKHAAEVFRGLMPTLEKTGVTLAVEPLAPAETNFLPSAAEAVELIEMVDSPRCRLLLDCKAMASEKTDIPTLIQRHHKHLAHFHANDPNLQGPGFGKLDFVPILRELRRIGYKGWVSVEVFDYSPGAERLARESIAYLKKCAQAAD
jgi:sugar phosphate isomerase/epimerase